MPGFQTAKAVLTADLRRQGRHCEQPIKMPRTAGLTRPKPKHGAGGEALLLQGAHLSYTLCWHRQFSSACKSCVIQATR